MGGEADVLDTGAATWADALQRRNPGAPHRGHNRSGTADTGRSGTADTGRSRTADTTGAAPRTQVGAAALTLKTLQEYCRALLQLQTMTKNLQKCIYQETGAPSC